MRPSRILSSRLARDATAVSCVTTHDSRAIGVQPIQERRRCVRRSPDRAPRSARRPAAGRAVGKRPRDGDPLHLAARQLRRQMVARGPTGRRTRAAPASVLGARRGDTRFRLRQLDVLPRGQHRQQEEPLKHEPDSRSRSRLRSASVSAPTSFASKEHFAGRRRVDAAEQVQQRGLAATRRPDDPDVIAGVDAQRHVVERDDRSGRASETRASRGAPRRSGSRDDLLPQRLRNRQHRQSHIG